MLRKCTKCGNERTVSEFGRDSLRNDGIRPICKPCCREVAKLWELRTKDKRVAQAKAWKRDNRALIKATDRAWRHSELGSISEMLSRAKKRARQDGLPFTLTVSDVHLPKLCPVFGEPLVVGTGKGPTPWSPSLDKIIPANGYVPGNVMVMSQKANLMKNSATPADLILFASWVNKTFANIPPKDLA